MNFIRLISHFNPLTKQRDALLAGVLCTSVTSYCLLLASLVFHIEPMQAQAAHPPFVVVLDAGHGGQDPGKHSKYGYKEKDIALKITLDIGRLLAKKSGIKIVYTRKKDVFVKLKERARIANKAQADLFVSIHCNAHHTQAYGTETYVLGVGNTNRNFEVAKTENAVIFLEDDYEKHYEGFNPNSPESVLGLTLAQEEYTDQSIQLADLIEHNFVKKNHRKSRGVKQASLWVIHQTAMPSVLIETGFITNKKEGSYLNSKRGQQQVAKAIADAIIKYRSTLYDNTTTTGVFADNSPSKKGLTYKVQIAASRKSIATKSYNFKGLMAVSKQKIGSLHKYFYGRTEDYNQAKALLKKAKAKGYKSSFIVRFKKGKIVPR